MFRQFPIFYMATPDGEGGGGGEGGESSEESGTDSGTGQAVDYGEEATSKSDSQQPQAQDTREREGVKGTGEKYLKVTPYVGPPSQPRRCRRRWGYNL